uniref:Uncharacterized protein n=1 Tax=Meloidogyne incognita TaxID=6306 RepID=A0A914M2L1_MELIC
MFPLLFPKNILLIFILLFSFPNPTITTNLISKRIKRERIAFDLLRLEKQFELLNNLKGNLENERKIDEEENCHQKCNEQLRMGLDMVKSHSSFGSVGVPSVIDKLDLQLFCNLDLEHDNCLIGNCGSARCGPYTELKLTFNGMGQRCKTLANI